MSGKRTDSALDKYLGAFLKEFAQAYGHDEEEILREHVGSRSDEPLATFLVRKGVLSRQGAIKLKLLRRGPLPSFEQTFGIMLPRRGLAGSGNRTTRRRPRAATGEIRVAEGGTPRARPVAAVEGSTQGILFCPPYPPVFLAPGKIVSIGRDEGCDLRLRHSEVSRQHATITVGELLTIEDEGSANGTHVNGAAITRSMLQDGDVIAIGPFRIEISLGAEEESAADLEKTRRLDPAVSLKGKLEDMPLTEILQSIEFHKKTGILRISAGNQSGMIVVDRGLPMFARCGDVSDDEAVLALLRFREGTFSFVSMTAVGRRSMTSTLLALMLEDSRRQDEA